MTNLEKYRDILRRYRAGEFGERYLTLRSILNCAGEPELIKNMTATELETLMSETTSLYLKAYIKSLWDSKVG